jgi:outer membrane protein TolC
MRPGQPSLPPTQRSFLGRPVALAARCIAPVLLCSGFAISASAQLSLTSAVDLALRNNPRVLSAQDDVKRAAAQIDEVHDAYIPSINAGAGIGQAYGYLPNPPTLFTVTAGSLAFSISQLSYTRSARAGFNAAELSLKDAKEAVAQDAAVAFLQLDHDQQRQQAIDQQRGFANNLVTIVGQRVDAGQDTQIDLKQAQITAAELRVASLTAGDTVAGDRDHLARLIGLPAASLTRIDPPPEISVPDEPSATNQPYATPGIASAFANAEAKLQQAKGDGTFRYWPQINFFAQYNRYATFTDSFKTLENLNDCASSTTSNTTITCNNSHIGADEGAFGVQITLPFFDRVRSAKSRESYAEAAHTLHEAQNSEIEALDGQARLRHSIEELQAQTELATLQQQYAQLQLDVLQQQMQGGTGTAFGPQMTPKDEQKARIAERDKYLAVIDATFQVRQSEIQLLRQTGQLEQWLRSLATAPTNLPAAPAPKP